MKVRLASLVAAGLAMALGTAAHASTVYNVTLGPTTGPSGDLVSATAKVTVDAGTVKVELTNNTPVTHDAGDLLTGFEFSLGGLGFSGSTTLASSSGDLVNIASDGSVTDLGVQSLNSTWSLNAGSFGSAFDLQWKPDPSGGILGPADGDGSYAIANSSIDGNGPHNPFVKGTATFILNIAGVTENTLFTPGAFLFGTGPDPVCGGTTTNVPVPASAWMGMGLMGAMGLVKAARRRKAIAA